MSTEAPGLDEQQRSWIAQQLGARPIRFAPTVHGHHSKGSWRVEGANDSYFYKCLQPEAGQAHEVGVAQRVFNNQEAERLGFGPEVVAVDEVRGALLLRMVAGEGGSYAPEDVARFRRPLLRALRQFHMATATGQALPSDAVGHHTSCATLQLRALAVPDAALETVAGAAAACHAWTDCLELLERPCTRVHNDLNPRNMVCTRNVVHLIDWDALGYGDPLHDVALYALEHDFDIDQLDALLVDYQGDNEGLERLQLYLARLHARRYMTLTAGMPWDDPALRPQRLGTLAEQMTRDAEVLAL